MAGDPRIRGEHYLLVQPAPEAADHPRIRGEHRRSRRPSRLAEGSSPHTRGAPVRKGKRSGPVGIIPAYAGSTRDRGFSLGCDGDHPRIRGEHACEALYGARPGGSSPHTRGARAFEVAWRGCRGIIPAYAGSTRRDMRRNSSHLSSSPHTRGALVADAGGEAGGGGSSPHTRGARPAHHIKPHPFRIIPAYAGSTRRRLGRGPASPDHPRIRGEHGKLPRKLGRPDGSSPHTRGARHHHRHRLSAMGIIPAYAGSTCAAGPQSSARSDHPRGCA